jgi:hypothetical protein
MARKVLQCTLRRVQHVAARTIIRTSLVGDPAYPAGTLDVKLIPHDAPLRACTAGMADHNLYRINPQQGPARAGFAFSVLAVQGVPGVWPQLLRMTKDGTRLFVTLN